MWAVALRVKWPPATSVAKKAPITKCQVTLKRTISLGYPMPVKHVAKVSGRGILWVTMLGKNIIQCGWVVLWLPGPCQQKLLHQAQKESNFQSRSCLNDQTNVDQKNTLIFWAQSVYAYKVIKLSNQFVSYWYFFHLTFNNNKTTITK